MELKHGQRVTCKINGDEITDARISVDNDGGRFICQNVKSGLITKDRWEYSYSWSIGNLRCDESLSDVTDLKPVVDDELIVKYGDMLVSEGGCSIKVLGVCGDIVFLSGDSDVRVLSTSYTFHELYRRGYKLLAPESDDVVIEVEGKKKTISRRSAKELGLI